MSHDDVLLEKIATHYLFYGSFYSDLGLYNGKMGMIIFFFHYARYTGNSLYEDFAGELLDDIYEDITDNISFSQLCEIGWGILYLLQQGFVEGNADEVLEIIDERIELQHSEYMNIMEHYLRFRGTLKEKVANSYSPSDIMQRIVVSTNVEKLSWQNGLKLIWDERVIYNNEQ